MAESSELVSVNRDALDRLKARAGAAATAIRGEAGHMKGAATVGAVGALIAYLANVDEVKNADMVKKTWWLLPLAVLALGYYLHRKGSPHAKPILASGGFLLVQAYQRRPKPGAAPAVPGVPAQVQGPNTGDPMVGMLYPSGGGAAWLQDPAGNWQKVQLPPQLAAMSHFPQFSAPSFLTGANNTQGIDSDAEAARQLADAVWSEAA